MLMTTSDDLHSVARHILTNLQDVLRQIHQYIANLHIALRLIIYHDISILMGSKTDLWDGSETMLNAPPLTVFTSTWIAGTWWFQLPQHHRHETGQKDSYFLLFSEYFSWRSFVIVSLRAKYHPNYLRLIKIIKFVIY